LSYAVTGVEQCSSASENQWMIVLGRN